MIENKNNMEYREGYYYATCYDYACKRIVNMEIGNDIENAKIILHALCMDIDGCYTAFLSTFSKGWLHDCNLHFRNDKNGK